MKKPIIACLISSALFLGCSGSDDGAEAGAEGEYVEEGGAAQQAGNPVVDQAIDRLETDLQAKKYVEVTEGLAYLNGIPKSRAQEKEYLKTVHEVQRQLQEQAETDPQARQAYDYFGRMMTGR